MRVDGSLPLPCVTFLITVPMISYSFPNPTTKCRYLSSQHLYRINELIICLRWLKSRNIVENKIMKQSNINGKSFYGTSYPRNLSLATSDNKLPSKNKLVSGR